MKAFEEWRNERTDTSLSTQQRQAVTMDCHKCQAAVWKAALEWIISGTTHISTIQKVDKELTED